MGSGLTAASQGNLSCPKQCLQPSHATKCLHWWDPPLGWWGFSTGMTGTVHQDNWDSAFEWLILHWGDGGSPLGQGGGSPLGWWKLPISVVGILHWDGRALHWDEGGSPPSWQGLPAHLQSFVAQHPSVEEQWHASQLGIWQRSSLKWMHANTWILDHLLIAYGPICKFVAEVAYFVDFGGCFSVSRHFFSSFQLSIIKPALEKGEDPASSLCHNTCVQYHNTPA